MPTLSGPDNFNGQFSVAADGTISLTTPPFSAAGGTISPGPVIINANAPSPPTAGGLLELHGANGASPITVLATYGGPGAHYFRRYNGTAAAPTPILNGQSIGSITAQGKTSASVANAASLTMEATEDWTGSTTGARFKFTTIATGSNSLMDRVRIGAGVVIGNPAPDPGQGGLVLNQNAASLPVSINSGGTIFTAFSGDGQAAYIATVSNTLPSFLTRGYAGTAAAPMASPNGSAFGQLQMQGFNGTTFAGGALINGIATEAWTGTANGARLNFMTVAPGTTVMAERMTILGNGNVGIGTTTPGAAVEVMTNVVTSSSLISQSWTWAADPVNWRLALQQRSTGSAIAYDFLSRFGTSTEVPMLTFVDLNVGINALAPTSKLHVNGACANVSGAWTTISDASVKQDVAPYTRGLAAIVALKPVQFRYAKGTPFAEAEKPSRQLFGLIADEVKPHVPEIVGTTKATVGKKEGVELSTLEPGNLIYALINAVKELNAKVAALESATVH